MEAVTEEPEQEEPEQEEGEQEEPEPQEPEQEEREQEEPEQEEPKREEREQEEPEQEEPQPQEPEQEEPGLEASGPAETDLEAEAQALQLRGRRQYLRRTWYNLLQLQEREYIFQPVQYPNITARRELARRMHVTDARVQVWFRNRRARWRRGQRACRIRNVPPVVQSQPVVIFYGVFLNQPHWICVPQVPLLLWPPPLVVPLFVYPPMALLLPAVGPDGLTCFLMIYWVFVAPPV
ncbi:homeobox protein ESX1-like [Tupaia chinensis]|uniref:homeobox protein ESX1-like n=1 Tax=Tupaia chinensis TaxID=246437 RepID=UPI0003C8CE37|nr:homeobox protein ESX1-like [Tupaia chinensis]